MYKKILFALIFVMMVTSNAHAQGLVRNFFKNDIYPNISSRSLTLNYGLVTNKHYVNSDIIQNYFDQYFYLTFFSKIENRFLSFESSITYDILNQKLVFNDLSKAYGGVGFKLVDLSFSPIKNLNSLLQIYYNSDSLIGLITNSNSLIQSNLTFDLKSNYSAMIGRNLNFYLANHFQYIYPLKIGNGIGSEFLQGLSESEQLALYTNYFKNNFSAGILSKNLLGNLDFYFSFYNFEYGTKISGQPINLATNSSVYEAKFLNEISKRLKYFGGFSISKDLLNENDTSYYRYFLGTNYSILNNYSITGLFSVADIIASSQEGNQDSLSNRIGYTVFYSKKYNERDFSLAYERRNYVGNMVYNDLNNFGIQGISSFDNFYSLGSLGVTGITQNDLAISNLILQSNNTISKNKNLFNFSKFSPLDNLYYNYKSLASNNINFNENIFGIRSAYNNYNNEGTYLDFKYFLNNASSNQSSTDCKNSYNYFYNYGITEKYINDICGTSDKEINLRGYNLSLSNKYNYGNKYLKYPIQIISNLQYQNSYSPELDEKFSFLSFNLSLNITLSQKNNNRIRGGVDNNAKTLDSPNNIDVFRNDLYFN